MTNYLYILNKNKEYENVFCILLTFTIVFPLLYPFPFHPLTLSFVILCHSLYFLFTEITSPYRSPLLFYCQYH